MIGQADGSVRPNLWIRVRVWLARRRCKSVTRNAVTGQSLRDRSWISLCLRLLPLTLWFGVAAWVLIPVLAFRYIDRSLEHWAYGALGALASIAGATGVAQRVWDCRSDARAWLVRWFAVAVGAALAVAVCLPLVFVTQLLVARAGSAGLTVFDIASFPVLVVVVEVLGIIAVAATAVPVAAVLALVLSPLALLARRWVCRA